MTSVKPAFPVRYEPLERLGEGGSGEVWSARDRVSGAAVALKLLRADAEDAEIMALVREAAALSGIEGLGVPRVLSFGRLPGTKRVYLARELVHGSSLAQLIEDQQDVGRCVSALVQAADLLTSLHRALLFHGDIKPANIIVDPGGRATLVDLGLAAPWREGGAKPEGLTPRFAAPELFRGAPLTPQVEVYALGASLTQILSERGGDLPARQLAAAKAVARRATDEFPSERFPSVDEFAEALRSAVQVEADRPDSSTGSNRHEGSVRRPWTMVGLDDSSSELLRRAELLGPRDGLLLGGPSGSGRTTLLRRLSWSLGVRGHHVIEVDGSEPRSLDFALDTLAMQDEDAKAFVLVDDAHSMTAEDFLRLDALRLQGGRLIAVVGGRSSPETISSSRTFAWFEVAPIPDDEAHKLVGQFIPSLGDELRRELIARSAGYPGPLRQLVDRLGTTPMVSLDDLDAALDGAPVPEGVRIELVEIHRLLDRGRMDAAAAYLDAYGDEPSVSLGIARARVAVGRGMPKLALEHLERCEAALEGAPSVDLGAWLLQKARAHNRSGEHELARAHAERSLEVLGFRGDATSSGATSNEAMGICVDALSVAGVARSMSGDHLAAEATIARGIELARKLNLPRTLAIALGSLAFAYQRGDRLEDAEAAHLEALRFAEQAGDAGHVGTTRLNLAAISHNRGDLTKALEHLEAAVDMGRRSGRVTTVRQGLFNLASLDLYLGRAARAQASLELLAESRDMMSPTARAQLLGLEAESCVLGGDHEAAVQKCLACAQAYQRLGRNADAAEALLEGVLVSARYLRVEPSALRQEVAAADALLAGSGAHETLRLVAAGVVAHLQGDSAAARAHLSEAVDLAKKRGQRDWLWRALVARSEVAENDPDGVAARDDRHAAVSILDDIASSLPMDLREVFWSDPRRSYLRYALQFAPGTRTQASVRRVVTSSSGLLDLDDPAAPTQFASPLETLARPSESASPSSRLALLLEINRELAGEYDLARLLERVTDRAVQLLDAERGFVLLRSRADDDKLSVHAARDRSGDEAHAVFSRSIAERVLATGEPFLAVDALSDERVSDYVSVHKLMLRSVVCAPIRSRSGRTIGALYLESRTRSASSFAAELPTLAAFSEQVAIAIETARLLLENRERALELEHANRELASAKSKLEEVLGRRTEQLQETKRSLRSVKAVLRGHFGYGEIVGTSEAMRRVYAVVERVKDADVPVLLTGESGTGKEVIARTIHSMGSRAKEKFVGVNCGAIPEHLLEGELFGHVRGAFTGADRDKKGLFREIDGGTILLDEIGEMPQKMQAGLLRVLQEKVVRPVGGTKEERVDVRVIAATHRDLEAMVRQGTFREDLFYRLNVIAVRTPALRERAEDVPLLVDHFLRIFAARYGRERRALTRDALRLLQAHPWPGNVRQLENVLLNAWILSDGEELGVEDIELPSYDRGARRVDGGMDPGRHPTAAEEPAGSERPESQEAYDELERRRMLEALERTGWNRAAAARELGMPRRTFYRRLKQYEIG